MSWGQREELGGRGAAASACAHFHQTTCRGARLVVDYFRASHCQGSSFRGPLPERCRAPMRGGLDSGASADLESGASCPGSDEEELAAAEAMMSASWAEICRAKGGCAAADAMMSPSRAKKTPGDAELFASPPRRRQEGRKHSTH